MQHRIFPLLQGTVLAGETGGLEQEDYTGGAFMLLCLVPAYFKTWVTK